MATKFSIENEDFTKMSFCDVITRNGNYELLNTLHIRVRNKAGKISNLELKRKFYRD